MMYWAGTVSHFDLGYKVWCAVFNNCKLYNIGNVYIMFMFVCLFVCLFVYLCVCMCVCVCVYVCMYMWVYMYYIT